MHLLVDMDSPDIDLMQTLLDAGADVNAVDRNGLTPLFRCIGNYVTQLKTEIIFDIYIDR
tara:strand:+ start:125 stop:304 length:180 start_codon:yes stop_codon:yes gene_type:complete